MSYYKIGTIYLEKRDYDEAIFYFNKSLEIDPELIGSYFNRGVSYFIKRLQKVISAFLFHLGYYRLAFWYPIASLAMIIL